MNNKKKPKTVETMYKQIATTFNFRYYFLDISLDKNGF